MPQVLGQQSPLIPALESNLLSKNHRRQITVPIDNNDLGKFSRSVLLSLIQYALTESTKSRQHNDVSRFCLAKMRQQLLGDKELCGTSIGIEFGSLLQQCRILDNAQQPNVGDMDQRLRRQVWRDAYGVGSRVKVDVVVAGQNNEPFGGFETQRMNN